MILRMSSELSLCEDFVRIVLAGDSGAEAKTELLTRIVSHSGPLNQFSVPLLPNTLRTEPW